MGTAEKYSFLAALELDDADLLDVKLNKLLEYLGKCHQGDSCLDYFLLEDCAGLAALASHLLNKDSSVETTKLLLHTLIAIGHLRPDLLESMSALETLVIAVRQGVLRYYRENTREVEMGGSTEEQQSLELLLLFLTLLMDVLSPDMGMEEAELVNFSDELVMHVANLCDYETHCSSVVEASVCCLVRKANQLSQLSF